MSLGGRAFFYSSPSPSALKEIWSCRYDGTSGAPVFANGAVTGAFSRGFNDEAHLKVNARLPKPVRALAKLFGWEAPGYSVRASASFPGLNDEARWNLGISIERDTILTDVSLGRATTEVGYNWQSDDVSYPNPARAAEVDVTASPPIRFGAVIQYDSTGATSGFGISTGKGIGASLTQPEAIYSWRLRD